MRICIDARSPGYAGVLNYAACLLRALAALDSGHEFIVLRAPGDPEWDIHGMEERQLPGDNPLGWFWWSNTALVQMLEREQFDIYHSLKHITLLRGPTKKIVTFHSARFLIQPQHYKWYDYAYWRILSPLAARRYDAILAVSEAEKHNYVERMGAPAEKFRISYLAADERFRVIEDPERLARVRAQYRLPERFLLYVGRLLPAKNIESIVRGFRHARNQGLTHDLVLVGASSWYSSSLESLIAELGLAGSVHLTGPIFEELPEVYNLADLFVFPSHYESFGAVPLEAMACGTPVLTSDRGGIPEVVGDAALVVPATDTGQLGDRIREILASEELQRSMRQRGLERSKMFSWSRCAEQTARLYEELAAGGQTVPTLRNPAQAPGSTEQQP